jgi:hypothetical protein
MLNLICLLGVVFKIHGVLFVRPRLITPSALRGQAKITPEHLLANFAHPLDFYQCGCPTSDAGNLSMFARSQSPYKNMVIDGFFFYVV